MRNENEHGDDHAARTQAQANSRKLDTVFLFAANACVVCDFHYWPIYGIQIAFQNYKIGQTFGSSQWVGLKYFKQFFSSYWFPTVMRNTVTISLLGFALSFPLPIVLALLLNEVSHEGYKKTVQTITYAPHFISTVVLCGALQLFLSPTSGLIGQGVNAIRQDMGLADVNILMDGPAVKWVYVLSGVWQGTGLAC